MNTPTPQAPLEYAGFWIRFWAFIVDSILIAIIVEPIVAAVYRGVESAPDPDMVDLANLVLDSFKPQGTVDFLLSWVFPAIAVIIFWIYRAATPGKMLVRAKIVDAATGAPPKSLIRMFGPRGNPQAKNLFSVIGYLQKRAGVQLSVAPR